jgi:hypothetical protein
LTDKLAREVSETATGGVWAATTDAKTKKNTCIIPRLVHARGRGKEEGEEKETAQKKNRGMIRRNRDDTISSAYA